MGTLRVRLLLASTIGLYLGGNGVPRAPAPTQLMSVAPVCQAPWDPGPQQSMPLRGILSGLTVRPVSWTPDCSRDCRVPLSGILC